MGIQNRFVQISHSVAHIFRCSIKCYFCATKLVEMTLNDN